MKCYSSFSVQVSVLAPHYLLRLCFSSGGPSDHHRRWHQACRQGWRSSQRGGLDDLGQRLGRSHDISSDTNRKSPGEFIILGWICDWRLELLQSTRSRLSVKTSVRWSVTAHHDHPQTCSWQRDTQVELPHHRLVCELALWEIFVIIWQGQKPCWRRGGNWQATNRACFKVPWIYLCLSDTQICHFEAHILVAYLPDREADTSKQNQVNKEERFNRSIGVIRPIIPWDGRERQIQREHVQCTKCIRSAEDVAVSWGEHTSAHPVWGHLVKDSLMEILPHFFFVCFVFLIISQERLMIWLWRTV